jgi:hypothetical protein
MYGTPFLAIFAANNTFCQVKISFFYEKFFTLHIIFSCFAFLF